MAYRGEGKGAELSLYGGGSHYRKASSNVSQIVLEDTEGLMRFRALYDYEATGRDELTFYAGDEIHGYQVAGESWWQGYVSSAASSTAEASSASKRDIELTLKSFPANYVDVVGPVNSATMVPAAEPAPPPKPPKKKKKSSAAAPKKTQKPWSEAGVAVKKTRYSLWGSYIALYGCFINGTMGVLLLLWGMTDPKDSPGLGGGRPSDYGAVDTLSAIYSIVFSAGFIFYELKNESSIRNGGVGYRNKLVYYAFAMFLGPLPGMLALPTLVGALHIMISSLMFYLAFKKSETYEGLPKKRKRKTAKVQLTFEQKFWKVYGGSNIAARSGRVVFLTIYWGSCFTYGLINAINAQKGIDEAKANGSANGDFTVWVPVAKFFGGVMNINFTVLLLPVCRTFVSKLYTYSTGDQTAASQTLRAFLKYTPLDMALHWHMLCGWVGFASAILHTVAHVINYGMVSEQVWETFGWSVWVTGLGLLFIIALMATSVQRFVRRDHHELFMYTHYLFVPFILLCTIHGKGWVGPNYWKFLLVPGSVYALERIVREIERRQPCNVLGATIMSNKVVCLRIDKDSGPFRRGYKIGQYCFLKCPMASGREWHPFTISSPPEDDVVTFHIRVQAENSWTWRLQQFLREMAPHSGSEAVKIDFSRMDRGKNVPGKIVGPTGKPLLLIYGPLSAPTQHLTEYNEVVVCTTGIGITPLAASMKSIVAHRWRLYSGKTYPDRATFCWICSHRDIKSFRWFIKLVHSMQDTIFDYVNTRSSFRPTGGNKTGFTLSGNKMFTLHIYITSVPKDRDLEGELAREREYARSNPVSFWGEEHDPEAIRAPFTPMELYSACFNPREKFKEIGYNVFVHNGRPDWNPVFESIANKTPERDIGVTFCGNPIVANDLSDMCTKHSRPVATKSDPGLLFHLHQEVF